MSSHTSEIDFTAAADLLSDSDNATRVTRPYPVPAEEVVDELFGDCTRTSAQFTVPISLDELPDEAYPTEIYLIDVEPS